MSDNQKLLPVSKCSRCAERKDDPSILCGLMMSDEYCQANTNGKLPLENTTISTQYQPDQPDQSNRVEVPWIECIYNRERYKCPSCYQEIELDFNYEIAWQKENITKLEADNAKLREALLEAAITIERDKTQNALRALWELGGTGVPTSYNEWLDNKTKIENIARNALAQKENG